MICLRGAVSQDLETRGVKSKAVTLWLEEMKGRKGKHWEG